MPESTPKKKPTTPTPSPDTAGPSEETKAKFREALERKNAHDAVANSGETGGGKVAGARGPARQQQRFRRKAGG